MQVKGHVYKWGEGNTDYPWHYDVEYVPPREDTYDYGSVATFPEAIAAVMQCVSTAAKEESQS